MELRTRGLRHLLHHPRLLRYRGLDQKALKVRLPDVEEVHLQRPHQLEDLLPKLNLTENQLHQGSLPRQEDHLPPDLPPRLHSKAQGNSQSSRIIKLPHEAMPQVFQILGHLHHPGRQRLLTTMHTNQARVVRNLESLPLLWDSETLHHLQHQAGAQFLPHLQQEKHHNPILIPSRQQTEFLHLHYLRKRPRHPLHTLLHYRPPPRVLYLLLQAAPLLDLHPYLNQAPLLPLLCLNQVLRRHRLYLNRTPHLLRLCPRLVDLLLHRLRLLEDSEALLLPHHPHQTAIPAINLEFPLYHNLQEIEQIC